MAQTVDELKAIAKQHVTLTFGMGGVLKALRENLQLDEVAEIITRAKDGHEAGILALTDRRLLFVSKAGLQRNVIAVPYTSISGVQQQRNGTSGTLSVTGQGVGLTFHMIRRTALPVVAARIQEGQHPSI